MKSRIALVLLIAVMACKGPARKLPYYDTPEFTPKWEMPDARTFHRIRPFSLVDQQNKRFTEADMDGKITVVDFFFTSCPGICPKMTNSMGTLQKEFLTDEHIQLLSHSVTPERDSVPVLAEYARKKHVDARRWKLLTGSKSEIYDLGRKFYFVEEDEGVSRGPDIFLHTENFVLVDKQRRIRGIYNGLDGDSIQALIRDIKTLEAE